MRPELPRTKIDRESDNLLYPGYRARGQRVPAEHYPASLCTGA